MSTHTIGSVRLLALSLVLLLAGAGIYHALGGAASAHQALIIRGGALELEPWGGDLRADAADLRWDYPIGTVQVAIAKAESEDEAFVMGEPVTLSGVTRVRIDLRVSNTRMIEDAVTVTMDETGGKIAVKEGQLARKGDVWVHSGFIQDKRHTPYEIARIEFFDRSGQSVLRYQNPDLGRRLRFRLKLSA